MLDAVTVDCPYCGEPIELLIEPAEASVRYVEDCHVCCRPITVSVEMGEDGMASVSVGTQDDV
jgi:hypothetical protein